jgi:hypothetical protein
VFVPVVVLIFVMGVFPHRFLVAMEPAVERFISDFKQKLAEPDLAPHLVGQPPPEQGKAGQKQAADGAEPDEGEQGADEGEQGADETEPEEGEQGADGAEDGEGQGEPAGKTDDSGQPAAPPRPGGAGEPAPGGQP